MCSNMGAGSVTSSASKGAQSAIRNALAGNKVDLDYALMKANEYGNVTGGGTRKTQELFRQWNDEAKRLSSERTTLETKQKAMDRLIAQVKGKGTSYTTPIFKLNGDGNIEFEYKGTETRVHEKGGKMQSTTKSDTVEVTRRYYGIIRVSGAKMAIERRSEIESEKIIKRGRL